MLKENNLTYLYMYKVIYYLEFSKNCTKFKIKKEILPVEFEQK